METLDLNNKRKREKLTASEWNSLIDAINLLILRYNLEATIPTKLSQLINDAGFITDISGKADKSDLARVATTGSYNDLKDKPDLSNIGSAGKSAYELAVENGYQGTIQLWLLSLKGQDGTAAGQLQADWNQSDNTQVDYIKNKPTIPLAPVQSDWNESDSNSLAYIANKPTIPTALNNENASSGGATLSAVTTGEKYNWNNKASIWSGTQAQYDAITTPDPNTIYIITAASS